MLRAMIWMVSAASSSPNGRRGHSRPNLGKRPNDAGYRSAEAREHGANVLGSTLGRREGRVRVNGCQQHQLSLF
eukprot:6259910-Pyramimonas_sp.AAC.1